MQDISDAELLERFARSQSEEAFAELVRRHIALVHSVALRHADQPQQAQEITQAVFIILARKAAGLGRRTVLSGWLYHAARLTAANCRRAEFRRIRREQEAYMQSTLEEPAPDAAWRELAPLLDEAMARLGETDRNAVVLRYFENKSLEEVGMALGLEARAAQKRVSRALEKLRRAFTRRGVTLSVTAIAGSVAANSVQAAPAALAAATVASATAKGTLISATLTTLVQGTMKTMMWLKLKFAAGAGLVALLAGGVVTVAISQTANSDRLPARRLLEKAHDAYAALSSYSDSGTVVSEIGGQTNTTTFNMRLQRPNFYRIDWTQENVLNKGVVWSAGSGDNFQVTAAEFLMLATRQKQNANPQKMPDLKTALAVASPLSGSSASTIPGLFFNQDLGNFTTPAASGRYPLKKESDAKVGEVDCYVVSSAMIDLSKEPNIGKPGAMSTTFWIGKKDFLIHQSRTRYVEKADLTAAQSDQAIDDAIKASLKIQKKPATPEAVAAMRPQMREIMKQVQSTLKTSFESGIVSTETHTNIAVNQRFSAADFAH